MSRISNKNSIDIQPSEAENDSPIFTHHQNLSICKLQSESSIGTLFLDIERQNNHKINNSECFYTAIQPILTAAKFFGIMPVIKVQNNSQENLIFIIKPLWKFYSIFIISYLGIIFLTVITSLTQKQNNKIGNTGYIVSLMIFLGINNTSILIFFCQSSNWIKLQKKWHKVEKKLMSFYGNTQRLQWKFKIISTVMLMLALGEHALMLFTDIRGHYLSDYFAQIGQNYLTVYKFHFNAYFFDNSVSQITLGILIRIAFFYSTFIWNFTDLFIILVSTGLAEKYKCLNKIVIKLVVKNNECNIDWPEIREKYTIISNLVKQTNNVISPLILLSFAGNLYFICIQFFKGFARPVDNDVLSEIYFFGSFGFLVCRAAAVTLSAARIHHQSRIILFALFHCPVSNANYEPQWFQNQLAIDEVALTGMDFFSITRKFMLKIVSTIITYEVILLQVKKTTVNNQ